MASQTLHLDVEAQSVERWKIHHIIQQLSELKARDASLITITIPSNDQLDQITKLLTEEMETASVTNSSQTQDSVQQALITAQSLLNLYSQRKLPPNGLVLYCAWPIIKQQIFLEVDYTMFSKKNPSKTRCN
ncbi:unnamed protein product [Didymodactylos carnosus]|uniref:Eukaryotic peptide chain release factor subunit 1 n=1 Tax=Didymodactylos carnosus TaxID=1234261 RepID=A0A814Z127_9BILA|nr:unnamed protein product [Didymodactylos carnosus]CAF1393824.1 unnamed protein product [Didymodactylos carnosus]CAF3999940.1 unnamed protein product [Didymodactylos carnosus]CAF4201284.1 unnamed protein product [Didymodactylos carnosus]